MLRQKTHIKQTACLIILVYLFLSGAMLVEVGNHAATHEHGANHAKQHASFVCSWMCAAPTHVHSAEPSLNLSFNPFFETLAVYSEPSFTNLSIFSHNARPPPVVFLS